MTPSRFATSRFVSSLAAPSGASEENPLLESNLARAIDMVMGPEKGGKTSASTRCLSSRKPARHTPCATLALSSAQVERACELPYPPRAGFSCGSSLFTEASAPNRNETRIVTARPCPQVCVIACGGAS